VEDKACSTSYLKKTCIVYSELSADGDREVVTENKKTMENL
jgi:hypothetical protein